MFSKRSSWTKSTYRTFKCRDYTYTILKYLFSVIITLFTFNTTGDYLFILIPMLELIIILVLSNYILRKYKKIGQILNNIIILLYNIEILVLIFGNSFVTLIMITNLDSWEALKGRILTFTLGIVLLLLFSFLPIKYIEIKPKNIFFQKHYFHIPYLILLVSTIIIEVMLSTYGGYKYSPTVAVYDLAKAEYKYIELLKKTERESAEKKEKFYKEDVVDYVKKPQNLPKNPNVILIFTEGMSQHIIDDDRNITPNIKNIQSNSLNFTNYYNHTFATYCGLIGQLFSGYQLNNFDKNYLVSLPQVLSKEGYDTSFINTESNNKEFSTYLSHLGFDRIVNSPISKGQEVSFDMDAYDALFEQITNQDINRPFFTSIYTFGTHIGMDSFDKKFQDGSDKVLNRFYDLDYQFGEFIKKFNSSPLAENTIIIFTTDHATYVDDEYLKAFPNHSRTMGNMDKVPFFVYYKGIEPKTIDVFGRNSIDLVPTILDYLDFSRENYFLGTSLFADEGRAGKFSHIFISELTYRSSKNNIITDFSKTEESNIEAEVTEYYSAARFR